MAILNPCCCITLRTGAKIVSIVDLIVALILLIIFISDLTLNISENGKRDVKAMPLLQATTHPPMIITPSNDDQESSCEDDYDSSSVTNNMSNNKPLMSVASVSNTPYVTSGVWTILTVFLATNVGISALLYTGSRNYSIRRCKWWFYIQTIITAVSLIVLILIICFQVSFALVVLDIIHLLYRFYTLWVVYLFIGELTYLDTLCSLNKKGGSGGIMYPYPAPQMYTSSISSPPPTSYSNGFTYIENPYQLNQSHHHPQYMDTGNGITSMESPAHMHYNSSDDGLPGNGGVGGIDNPTYLH